MADIAIWVCLTIVVTLLVCLGNGMPARSLALWGLVAFSASLTMLGVFILVWTHVYPSNAGLDIFGWVIGMLCLVLGAMGLVASVRANRGLHHGRSTDKSAALHKREGQRNVGARRH